MLSAIPHYFRADAPAAARRIGLLDESVAIWSRGRRRRADWRAHERHCHDIVRRAVAGLPSRRRLIVLGSGLGLDIPLDELAGAFGEVLLADAVHLRIARRRAARFSNITLLARDLTGALDWIVGREAARADAIADLVSDPSVDLVISANILSQLPIAPEKWLERHPDRARALPGNVADRLIGWHLDDLARFSCRVCLLTDVVMEERGRNGALLDSLDLMRGHSLPAPDEAWDWTVAPFGEIERDREYVHRVHGHVDLAASFRRAENGGRA